MNKNVLGILVAVIAIAGIAGVVVANQPDKSSSTSLGSSTSGMAGMDMSSNNEGTNQPTGEQDLTGQAEITVDIKNFEYLKNNIKVSKGTKVTWVNQDAAKHNVVSDNPAGPQSELLAKGESFGFTFDTAGTFNYLCEPHPYMKGVVTVVE